MNWRSIRAITFKDIKEVRQNKAAWIPALVVPLIFAVLMPIMFVYLPQAFPGIGGVSQQLQEIQQLITHLPTNVAAIFDGLSLEQTWAIYSTGFLLAPLFLVMPLMFSTIIGADSFAGERERKTMEALLYTPASDSELFLGKVLAAVAPAVLLSWITFLVYIVVVNATSFQVMGRIWFPLPAWWPLMLWLTPAIAVMGISATVLISSSLPIEWVAGRARARTRRRPDQRGLVPGCPDNHPGWPAGLDCRRGAALDQHPQLQTQRTDHEDRIRS
jgi:ABC-2 type transport system permease protein